MKTKYPGITFDKKTKTYTVKFNYKEYSPKLQRNVYKSRYKYGCRSLTEAREELRRLQEQENPKSDEDITIAGIFELYELSARARGLSETTIENTSNQLRTIARFIPSDTKLKNITIDTYNSMVIAMRAEGIQESSIRTYTATMKKLFRLAYQREYITADFFDKNPVNYQRKQQKSEDSISSRIITKEQFFLLDNSLQKAGIIRKGVDINLTYRLLLNLLYYGGLRIGEALALVYSDFEIVGYTKHQKSIYVGRFENDAIIFQVAVTKTLVRSGGKSIVKNETKNHKERFIPLPATFQMLFLDYIKQLTEAGEDIALDRRVFPYDYGTVQQMLPKLCKKAGIPRHKLHDFRHTYISNLVANNLPISDVAKFSGDTEETILETYAHATEEYKLRLLETLSKL